MNTCEFCGREFKNKGALAQHRRWAHISPRTHCPKGHPYDDENTIWGTRRDGCRYRKCAACVRLLWEKRKDQYTRNRRGNPEEAQRQKAREYARRQRWPERYKARMAVFTALRNGTLVRSEACERCGAEDVPLDASHDDYSRPLDVEWLCRPCHGAKDRKRNPIRPPAYKQEANA